MADVSGQHKYRAFISYSHADEKWAAWLHKALETYKVPKHLVGKASDYGPVPERIAPIFRDREELATSTELGDVLTEALKQSACLIVICSPNAAKSRWTNEEILTYKRLGRQDRIFCLIIDGEPNASLFEETAEFECFPAGLMYKMGPDGNLTDIRSEPIAADAREGKDNKQNAKLKLIAGMIGVGFDDLKQREQHRRHQRMVAVTVAAAIGMAITTGLAATAWFARIEAEKQRVLAEEKAETATQTTQFMVGLFAVSDPSEARGKSITALEILDKGAGRIETELAGEPTVQATLMDTVGSVYMSLGLYDRAQPLLDGAFRRRREMLGAEHSDTAQTQAHLGELLRLRAKYVEAEQHYRDALAVQQRELGDTNPLVADSLAGLAEVLAAQGKFQEAEQILRQALDIRLNAYGEEHADVAQTLEDLALLLEEQGDLSAAISLMEESLAMQRRLWGKQPHPDLAESLNNLAFLLYADGAYERTERLFRESVQMKKQLLGERHPEIAVGLNNLAFVLHDKGDYEDAEAMYRQALLMHRDLVGDQHPDYAAALSNLAFLLYDKGDVRGALDSARTALAIYRELFPDGHPDVATSLIGIGVWLLEAGDYEGAEAMMSEGLATRQTLLGDDHPDVGSGLALLGMVSVATGRYEHALALSRDARAILDESLSPEHWRSALARIVEGAALSELGRFDEAEPLLVGGFSILSEDSGALRLYVHQSLRYLQQLYTAWDRPEEAARYAAMLL